MMTMTTKIRLIGVVLLICGCGGGQADIENRSGVVGHGATGSNGREVEANAAGAEKRSPELPVEANREESVHPSAESIPRAAFLKVLQEGIPRFLQKVSVEPQLDHGHFIGWRVVAFSSGDSRFVNSPIKPGDIVVAVNNRSIERPENLKEIWDGLEHADKLSFRILRDQKEFVIKFTIAN
jgi:type II secretory pathway component PulC